MSVIEGFVSEFTKDFPRFHAPILYLVIINVHFLFL
jgi:hypothetical protein